MNWLKLVIRKSRKIWRLDRNSQWLLLQALLLLPLVAISLKFWGLKRTQTGLARLLPSAKNQVENSLRHSQIIKTIAMVRLAARYYQPWANCLKKSLVLWGLLRHQGIESELRIGVQREAIKFEAHAWVECEGFVLNDTPDVRDRYAMFESPIEVNLS
ncbi:MAG: lasso peptide biosynthesis B2 protein [Cyanobacteria bacterium J06632_19]